MLSDKDAIIRIKNGEIDSYANIVRKYTSPVYMYIYSKLRNKEDSEDLVQNVFISFYKNINTFDSNRPVKPYLYQIVKNELKMFYRNYKKILPLKEEMYIEETEKTKFEEQNTEILSKNEKNMLDMIIKGYTYKEISNEFKKTLNTVKSIIRRARIKLKKYEES